jgi:hypothetical protein
MSLEQDILAAFGWRPMPEIVTGRPECDTDGVDARAFAGKPWQDIDRQLWDKHWWGIFAFTPDAFVYYLPSIFTLSLAEPEWPSMAADCVTNCLDRSPDPDKWDEFFVPRFGQLRISELEVLRVWIETVVGALSDDPEVPERCLATVDLLSARATGNGTDVFTGLH